jgi:hypothetical protein
MSESSFRQTLASGVFGFVSSTPIAAMEVDNGANDNDGLTYDDVIYNRCSSNA